MYIGGFVGCSYQMIGMSRQYFITGTTITIDIVDSILSPDLSVCIRYTDIIDLPLTPQQRLNTTLIRSIQRDLTIDQMFRLTPSEDKIIKSCFHRRPGSYRVIELNNATDCYQVFNVSKFYTQEYMCYRFHIIGGDNETSMTFNYSKITFSLTHAGLFFGIHLDSTIIPEANLIKFVLHETLTFPLDTIAFSSSIFLKVNGTNKYDTIKLDYDLIEIFRFHPPYDTNCRTYAEYEEMRKLCINNCLKEHIIFKMQKLPFTVCENQSLNIQPIDDKDIENEFFSRRLNYYESKCMKQCGQQACEEEFYTTYIQKEEHGTTNELTVLVQATTTASIRIDNSVLIPFHEFVVYVTSCVGTWLGMSMMSFNPVAISRLLHSRKKKETSSLFAKRKLIATCVKCRLLFLLLMQEIDLTRKSVSQGTLEQQLLFRKRNHRANNEESLDQGN